MTFSIDADGKVDRVTMKPVSPAADFSFDYQDLFYPGRTPELTRSVAETEGAGLLRRN